MSVLTRLRAGHSEARFLAETRVIYFFQQVQTGSVAHLTLYSIGTGVSSRRNNVRGVKLTTHLHPVPRFKLIGGRPLSLHPLCALMALTDGTSLLYIQLNQLWDAAA